MTRREHRLLAEARWRRCESARQQLVLIIERLENAVTRAEKLLEK